MYPRSIIINDVVAKWAKVHGNEAPTNKYNAKQWELMIQTTDAAKAKELADYGLKIKTADENGSKVYSVQLKRKGIKADGNPMAPVKVVDSKLSPMTDNIGNGSKVNVSLWQYEYNVAGNQGVSTSLTGVQVVDLVKYEGNNSNGFSVVGEEPAQMDIEAQGKSPF